MIRIFCTGTALLATLACADASRGVAPDEDDGSLATLLPGRSAPVDTSRITAAFRRSGGAVFVTLTAESTPAALEALTRAGLRPPPRRDQLVAFAALRIQTVWGVTAPGDVRRLAMLPFVTSIEPSADPDAIVPQG